MNQLVKRLKVDKYLYYKETHSTNDLAANLPSISSPCYNYCIYTYKQTDGKGQIGRKWYTGSQQNLASSFVFNNLQLPVSDHFLLNKTVSLAILSTLSSISGIDSFKIKWPNDIYFGNKKIAGILIQNHIKGQIITRTTIGIGININSSIFPTELPNPISLIQATENRTSFSLLNILHLLSHNLGQYLSKISFSKVSFDKDYLNHLYLLNEQAYFKSNEILFEGRILGVEESGKLKMDTPEGIRSFLFREITFESKL